MGDNEPLFVDSPEFVKQIKEALNDFPEWITFMDNNDNNLDNIFHEYIQFMFDNRNNKSINNGIRLMWRTHKLHPYEYKRDCFKCFGKVIKSDLYDFSFNKNEKKEYGTGISSNTFDDNESEIFTPLDYLKESIYKQIHFMRTIVNINDTEGYNIEQSIKEYKEFMLKIGQTSAIVVPSLNVDLIWHTHMLSDAYFNESIILSKGKFVNHDDMLDDNFLAKEGKKCKLNKRLVLFLIIITLLVMVYIVVYRYIFGHIPGKGHALLGCFMGCCDVDEGVSDQKNKSDGGAMDDVVTGASGAACGGSGG